MKTTVKTAFGAAATVQPLKLMGMVLISLKDQAGDTVTAECTPDQIGALMFGLEQAMAALHRKKRGPQKPKRLFPPGRLVN